MRTIAKDDLIPFGKELVDVLKQRTEKINLIIDFTEVKINTAFMQSFKKDGVVLKPLIGTQVAIGVKGISYVLMLAYQAYTKKSFVVFRTRDEAMKYLQEL